MENHLVLITCAFFVKDNSVFSPLERFQQILQSIASVRQKIPNPYIVLLETGSATKEQLDFINPHVAEIKSYSIVELKKNQGEAEMIYLYLTSPHFLKIKDYFQSIHKLSGRYFLTERFHILNYDLSKPLIKYRPDQRGGVFETRYYRFPMTHFPVFIERFTNFMNTKKHELEWDDVEHIFLREKFLDPENSITDKPIGVGGWYSGSGAYVED